MIVSKLPAETRFLYSRPGRLIGLGPHKPVFFRLWPFHLSINEGGRGVTFTSVPSAGLFFRLYVAGIVLTIHKR